MSPTEGTDIFSVLTTADQHGQSSSEVDRFLDGFQAAPLVWQVERLENVGEGGVMPANSLDRCLQVQETVLLGFLKKQLEFSTKE
jgi:hypothetical protein